MIRRLVVLLLGIMAICVTSAFAGDLEVEVFCPKSVNAGSALKVNAVAYNNGKTSVTLNRYAAGVVGNYNNIVNTGRVYGPYAKTMGSRTIPTSGAGVSISNITVISPVPTDIRGKMALVVLDFINNNGQSLGGNTCLVDVQ